MLRRGDPQLRGQPAHPRTRQWRVAAQRADGPGASADARRVRRARRVSVSVEGAGTLVAAGLGWRRVLHRSLCHRRAAVSRPAGASGVIMGAFGSGNETELEALFSEVVWYRKPSFADSLARVREARQCGFAVDRGTMFQGITQVSVPVLSPSWELLLVLTAAGHAHDFAAAAVGPLSRALQSAAARLSESVRLLRLG